MKLSAFLVCLTILVAVVGISSACDESHSFKFVNESAGSITLTYHIEEKDLQLVLTDHTYSIPAGQTVDTSTDEDKAGDRGVDNFDSGRVLIVHAEASGGRILVDETLSYNQVKDRDFRIVIGEAGIAGNPSVG
jgi:hypothetical protein